MRKCNQPKIHNQIKKKTQKCFNVSHIPFIAIGVGWAIYWFLVLRHYETTDNAYVAGNQVQIQSQISGSVMTVNVDNTDFVKSGTVLVELDPRDAQLALEKPKPL